MFKSNKKVEEMKVNMKWDQQVQYVYNTLLCWVYGDLCIQWNLSSVDTIESDKSVLNFKVVSTQL